MAYNGSVTLTSGLTKYLKYCTYFGINSESEKATGHSL